MERIWGSRNFKSDAWQSHLLVKLRSMMNEEKKRTRTGLTGMAILEDTTGDRERSI